MSANVPEPDKIPDMSLGERADRRPPSAPPGLPPLASSPIPAWEIPSSIQEHAAQASDAAVPRKKDDAPIDWQEGDRALAPWEPNFLYPGTIRQIIADDNKGDRALIDYDDGGEGFVFVYSLYPLEFKPGQEVEMRRPHAVVYTPGEVLAVDGDEIHVQFTNGDDAWASIRSIRIPCVENGPGASATRMADWQPQQFTDHSTGAGIPSWVYTLGLIILLAFLRFGCRAMSNN